VFPDSSDQVYESAAEAATDLKKRGFPMKNVKEPDSTAEKRRRLATWEKAGVGHRKQTTD